MNVEIKVELVKLHLNPDGWDHRDFTEIDHQFMQALHRLGRDFRPHPPRRAFDLHNPANVAVGFSTGCGVDLKDLTLRSSQSKQ